MNAIEPDQQRTFAIDVVRQLSAAGHVAYWAGGCVRDQLLGRVPQDYDIATNAAPEEIRNLFGRRRTLAIGAAFGVITVLSPRKGAGQIDVATFRRDAAYSDGRHPDSVTFSSAEEDAKRRDFTINGLFYNPLTDEVIDYVGGQEDLARRIVRAIGDPRERFEEDRLRMLRAVRFAAAFEFKLDDRTRDVIRELAEKLTVVSAERIAAEMTKMLTDQHRAQAVEMLRDTGLLSVVLPDSIDLPDDAAWQQTRATLEKLVEPELPLALAALLLPCVDKQAAGDVCRSWRLSNKETERTRWLLENIDALSGAADQHWPDLQRVLIHDGAADLLALSQARTADGEGSADDVAFCRERLAWPSEKLDPAPLLTGDDLLAHGVPRGKVYKTLLHCVRDAQLLGEINTRNEALALVDQLRQPGELT